MSEFLYGFLSLGLAVGFYVGMLALVPKIAEILVKNRG